MNKARLIGLAAATAAVTAVLAPPAQATTDHCDSALYPNKVDVDAGPTVYTGLPEGTAVCIKAGTEVDVVYVDADGNITNDLIFNQNGNARGISYYAYGGSYGGS